MYLELETNIYRGEPVPANVKKKVRASYVGDKWATVPKHCITAALRQAVCSGMFRTGMLHDG